MRSTAIRWNFRGYRFRFTFAVPSLQSVTIPSVSFQGFTPLILVDRTPRASRRENYVTSGARRPRLGRPLRHRSKNPKRHPRHQYRPQDDKSQLLLPMKNYSQLIFLLTRHRHLT